MGYALVAGQVATNATSTATATATLTNTPAQYNLILVGVAINKNISAITCTDGNSNSLTQIGVLNGSGFGIAVFAMIATASQSKAFTGGYSTSTFTQIIAHEFSGSLDTWTGTNILDVAAVTGSAASSPLTNSITPVTAGDLLFNFAVPNAAQGVSPTWSSTGGITSLTTGGYVDNEAISSYGVASGTSNIQPKITWTTSATTRMISVLLKAQPAPTLTASPSPASGSQLGGTSVTLTGTNLTGAPGAPIVFCPYIFSGTVTAYSPTSITYTTPNVSPDTGAQNVFVTTSGGNSNNETFTYTAVGSVTEVASPIEFIPGKATVTAVVLQTAAKTAIEFVPGVATVTVSGGSPIMVQATPPVIAFVPGQATVTAPVLETLSAPTITFLSGNAFPVIGNIDSPVDPQATANTVALYSTLRNVIDDTNILSGHMIGNVAGAFNDGYYAEFDQYQKTVGKIPAVMGLGDIWTYAWPAGTFNGNGVPIKDWTRTIELATQHASLQGGVIAFTALPYNPTPTGGNLNPDTSSPLSGSPLTNATCLQWGPAAAAEIGYGSSVSQTQDNINLNQILDTYATLANDLNAYGIPILFRIYPENNTSGFWWCGLPWTAQLWKYTLGYLTGNGGFSGQPTTSTPCHNLLFVWAVTTGSGYNNLPPTYTSIDFYGVDRYGGLASSPSLLNNRLTTMGTNVGYSPKLQAICEIFDGSSGNQLYEIASAGFGTDISTWTGSGTLVLQYESSAPPSTGTIAVATATGIQTASYTSYNSGTQTFHGLSSSAPSGSKIITGSLAINVDSSNNNSDLLTAFMDAPGAMYFQGWSGGPSLLYQQNLSTLYGSSYVYSIGSYSLPYASVTLTPQPVTEFIAGTAQVFITFPGSANQNYAYSGTASASVTVPASANQNYGYSGTATATVTIPATGNDPGIAFVGTAVGTLAATANQNYAYLGTATATVTIAGTGNDPGIAYNGSATGAVIVAGSANQNYAYSGTATATVTVPASANQNYGFTGTATATVIVPATANQNYAYLGVAVGSVTGFFFPTANQNYGFNGSAAGTVVIVGTGNDPGIAYLGQAAGVANIAGTGNDPGVAYLGAATATVTVPGTADQNYGYSGTAVGTSTAATYGEGEFDAAYGGEATATVECPGASGLSAGFLGIAVATLILPATGTFAAGYTGLAASGPTSPAGQLADSFLLVQNTSSTTLQPGPARTFSN